MTILDTLRRRDPDLLNLRKAARAAIVAFAVFAVLHWISDQGSLSAFGFFSCFTALAFSDFGGPRRPRALAYAAAVAIGAVLVLIGSLLSATPLGSAVGMFVIVFAVSFAAVFGGYAPAFVAPIALSYSLAVLIPLSDVAIDARLLGWTIGGGAALLAAIALWPVDQRLKLRRTLAEVSEALATALESARDREAAEAAFGKASDAMADARRKASTPLRPAGPTSRHVGQLHLVADLEEAVDITRQFLDGDWLPREDEQLAAACARVFRQVGAMLTAEVSPDAVTEDTERLDRARLDRRRLADDTAIEATAPHAPQSAAEALAEIRRSAPLMALSHVAMWAEADAATSMGGSSVIRPEESTPELSPPTDQPGEVASRARLILSAGLDPDGVIFRNSVRGAAAMTLAVVLAQLVPVAHSFWITLGALLVLRSSAASTSATALQAVAGTAIGFVAAAIILLLFAKQDAVLWTLLPFAIFFAGYTPGAVSFVVGQVSFTAMVVILFTLIDNVGISIDVARLETVTLGALSSALMSLILWPRGARAALARALAGLYRAAGEVTRTLVTDPDENRNAAATRMRIARRRADEAFGIALNERGLAIDVRAWLALSRAPNLVHSLAGGLLRQPPQWLSDQCGGAIAAVVEQRDALAHLLDMVGDRLDPSDSKPVSLPALHEPEGLEGKLLTCFERSRSRGPAGAEEALFLVAWSEHLARVGLYVGRAEDRLDRVARASRPDAWLRWSAPRSRQYEPAGDDRIA